MGDATMLRVSGWAMASGLAVFMHAHGAWAMDRSATGSAHRVRGGSITLTFDDSALRQLGWKVISRGEIGPTDDTQGISFAVDASSTFAVTTRDSALSDIVGGVLYTRGALLLDDNGSRIPLGNLVIGRDEDGRWTLASTLSGDTEGDVFILSSLLIDHDASTGRLKMIAELSISPAWAGKLGLRHGADMVIGILEVDADFEEPSSAELGSDAGSEPGVQTTVLAGPDVIVGELYQTLSWGSAGDISAFSVGTISCNIGGTPLNWFANTNQHPVIVQNMFRLKDGRFEQIGQGWLKHGFFALSHTDCSGPGGCTGDPTGEHLGVGCSDPYSASLNGEQANLGPRSQVNPHTGGYPYPWTAPSAPPTIGRRLQVHHADLDPALNSGAVYFVEGQYVTPDDAAAGKQDNNASYRPINVSGGGTSYSISLAGTTQRTKAGIRAWHAADFTVVEADVLVPGDGLFMLAAKVTDLGTGVYRYEYALQNLNVERAAASFSLPIFAGAAVTNQGFHDVDSHSGEPFSLTDWAGASGGGIISWSTTSFAVNPNANAIRWGTLYNFRFDANASPTTSTASIGLFKPGSPSSVNVSIVGPTTVPRDCSAGGICDDGNLCTTDVCDAGVCNYTFNTVACDDGNACTTNDACENGLCVGGPPPGCASPDCTDCNHNGIRDSCEGLPDCNANGLPDQCEFADCNNNGIADVCDIAAGTSLDCDGGPLGVISSGAARYASSCSACHGNNGSGGSAPDIRNSNRVRIWNQLLPPTSHTGGAFPQYTQQDFADLEAFLASAGSRGRPDHVPDECQALADCDADGFHDACELESGMQLDLDYDGVPDGCHFGPVTADPVGKNRYISFIPGVFIDSPGGGIPQAIRVKSPTFPGLVKWAGLPDASGISRLDCAPLYRDWGSAMLNVGDQDIKPLAIYVVQGLQQGALITDEAAYSDSVSIPTVNLWGDVAGELTGNNWTVPNGVVNFNDVTASIQRFLGQSNAPPLVWVDVDGRQPSKGVNFADIQRLVQAFLGVPYPFDDPVDCP